MRLSTGSGCAERASHKKVFTQAQILSVQLTAMNRFMRAPYAAPDAKRLTLGPALGQPAPQRAGA